MKTIALSILNLLFAFSAQAAFIQPATSVTSDAFVSVSEAFSAYKEDITAAYDDRSLALRRAALTIENRTPEESIKALAKKIVRTQLKTVDQVTFVAVEEFRSSFETREAMANFRTMSHKDYDESMTWESYNDLANAVEAATRNVGVRLYRVRFEALDQRYGAADYEALILVDTRLQEETGVDHVFYMHSFWL